MRAIEVGKIKKADSALVSPVDERFEFLLAHARVIGLAVAPTHARAKTEAADLELGFAQRHGFVRIKARGLRLGVGRELMADNHAADAQCRTFDEFAATDFHSQELATSARSRAGL